MLAAVTIVAFVDPTGGSPWEQPRFLFGLVVGSAVVCIVAATVVIALADRRDMAEIGLLGTALMAASAMPLVHGLVTPGVLYDDTAAFDTATFLSLPIAVAVAAPLMRPHSAFGRWAARHWRDWTLLALLGVFIIAAVVVFFPDAIAAPAPGGPATIVVSAGIMAALVALSLRQLRFYELGRQATNLVASVSLLVLAVTALLPIAGDRYGMAFWWLHVAGGLGVMGATAAMAATKPSRSAQELLAPVLARDPLAAFELGLSPVVHQFVADLARKDQVTRDHVVRTGELAMRVGERFRLSGRELRDLGLAALLHDVGKIAIPDEILKKPSSLTEDEYDLMKTHTLVGEGMLAAEPSLRSAAPIVRSHHERLDGGGYPDGLSGRDIPLASRIIAACDAFDAMTHDRPYRAAMSLQMAFAILDTYAGTQWDQTVIDQVKAALPSIRAHATFDAIGRDAMAADASEFVAADIEALLATVDAEI